jgi:hypothetical protein
MAPLGVQFGPGEGQTIVVHERLMPNGYQDRLNGPADNPMSSCMSCHARAQWPEPSYERLPFAPKDRNDNKIICLLHDWRGENACDLDCTDDCIPGGRSPISPSSRSVDYAQQMSLALRNSNY